MVGVAVEPYIKAPDPQTGVTTGPDSGGPDYAVADLGQFDLTAPGVPIDALSKSDLEEARSAAGELFAPPSETEIVTEVAAPPPPEELAAIEPESGVYPVEDILLGKIEPELGMKVRVGDEIVTIVGQGNGVFDREDTLRTLFERFGTTLDQPVVASTREEESAGVDQEETLQPLAVLAADTTTTTVEDMFTMTAGLPGAPPPPATIQRIVDPSKRLGI